MAHILANPAYNALISGNGKIANGTDDFKYFPPDIAPFLGLRKANPTTADFETLAEAIPLTGIFAFVATQKTNFPDPWKLVVDVPCLQMVFNKPAMANISYPDILSLNESHVPDMLALTKLTNPGPFLSNTIAFGNYKGIFVEDRLVAMAGHRLHPFNYVEISAVCTHPDYVGKGYARKLMQQQIQDIQSNNEIPFLHVKTENERAIKVYENLGFVTRKEVSVYIIKK